MLVGRIDVWLALDDYVRERFVVTTSNGQRVGVYTGRPAVFRPADLFEGKPAERTIVVDVFKDYPVGNTRALAAASPRAGRHRGAASAGNAAGPGGSDFTADSQCEEE